MKAVKATTDTEEKYCIVTSKGEWLLTFDGSAGPTFIAYPQQMNKTASPAINTQSAKNAIPDPTLSCKKTSTVDEQIDDQQVSNFTEDDPVAKPVSDEGKHATKESPESPGSNGSGDVHECLSPENEGMQMLSAREHTAGLKASHTSKHQSCTINSNGTDTRMYIYIYIIKLCAVYVKEFRVFDISSLHQLD